MIFLFFCDISHGSCETLFGLISVKIFVFEPTLFASASSPLLPLFISPLMGVKYVSQLVGMTPRNAGQESSRTQL